MSALERADAAARAAAPDEGGERSTRALLASLTSAPAEHEAWREQLNGRFVCFLRHAGRTYVVLPLEYAPLPGAEHPRQQEA